MKTQLRKPARERAKYTEEYKKEALELWRNSGRSAAKVAAELGIQWIHSAAQAKGTSFIPFAGPFVGGTNVQVQQLTVLLKKDGTVENYTMNESHPDVKMGGD
jgi:transposase-like protein